MVLACRGELGEAADVESQAVETMVAIGDDRMIAICRIYLAMIHDMAGDHERAERVAREALESARALPPLRARALAVLARSALHLGRVAEAESISNETMVAMSTARAEGGDVYPRLVRAEALLASGRTEEAKSMLRDAKGAIDRAAACILDGAVLEQFLTAVPENAAILALARAHGIG
jgi:ATP/maltotriose-dependent transcriptional regulator MalT